MSVALPSNISYGPKGPNHYAALKNVGKIGAKIPPLYEQTIEEADYLNFRKLNLFLARSNPTPAPGSYGIRDDMPSKPIVAAKAQLRAPSAPKGAKPTAGKSGVGSAPLPEISVFSREWDDGDGDGDEGYYSSRPATVSYGSMGGEVQPKPR